MMDQGTAAATTASSVASAGAAVAIDSLSLAFFGVPVSMWVACFSGALFGATWFPSDARVARPWAVVTNTLAGIFLTAAVMHLSSLPKPLLASIGFVVSTAPIQVVLFIMQWIRGGRTAPPTSPPSPPTSSGAQGGQP